MISTEKEATLACLREPSAGQVAQCFQSFTAELFFSQNLEIFLKFTFENISHDNIDVYYLCCRLIKKPEILVRERNESFCEL